MKNRIFILLIVVCFSNILYVGVHSQIIKKAGELLLSSPTFEKSDTSKNHGSLQISQDGQEKTDSLKVIELMLQLEEMKLNEIVLKSKLDENNHNQVQDSLKRVARIHLIDSLRSVTPGIPVVVEEDTLFKIYAARGGHSAIDRAETTSEAIVKIGKSRSLRRDSVYLLDNDTYIDIMYGDKVIISVTENDALWHSTTPSVLADTWMPIIADKIALLKAENSFWQILKRAGLFVLVIIFQYLMLKLLNFLFKKLRREIYGLRCIR